VSSDEPVSDPLRVVVAGAGAIGEIHARIAVEDPALDLVAIVNPTLSRAVDLAARLDPATDGRGISTYRDLATAIAGSRPELAVICTPTGSHVHVAREALAGGCHVLVEKPLDVVLTRAVELKVAADQAFTDRGLVTSVVSQHRFDPAVVLLEQAVKGDCLGTLTSGQASVAWWRSQGYYDASEWRGTWTGDGGGALMNQGIHILDVLIMLLGSPVEIFAHGASLGHRNLEVEETISLSVEFAGGVVAGVLATTAAYPGLTTRLQITGTRGSGVIENSRLTYFHRARADERVPDLGLYGGGDQSAEFPDASSDQPYVDATADPSGHRRQYIDMIRAIRTGTPSRSTIDDAITALATVCSAYVSASTGRAATLSALLAGEYDGISMRARSGPS
jgi:UDP-N-acetyl-2-amino-2-deoxyglucuronate dehydrogenase